MLSVEIPLGKSHLLLDAVIVLPVWSIRAGIVPPTDQSDCSMPPSLVITGIIACNRQLQYECTQQKSVDSVGLL